MILFRSSLFPAAALLALSAGCSTPNDVDVVDLNKVVDALVAVLDEGNAAKTAAAKEASEASDAAVAAIASTDGNAEVTSTAEIQVIEPEKQDPAKESEFLKKYAAKLNELKVMNAPVGVSMTAGGEIVGFQDPNENLIQDAGESKEFTVTMDIAHNRLVASDNNGYHRPHSYGFRPSGMMMGYMLGSMMGRQNSYYSGANAGARPGFANTPMSPANYHQSAVSTARSTRMPSSSSSSARVRTGSKGFSFGK